MIQYPNVIAFFSDIHFLIIIFDKSRAVAEKRELHAFCHCIMAY